MTKAAVISLFTEMTGLILWVQHLWGRHLTICYCNNFLKLKGPLPVVLTNGAYWRTVINPFAWSSIVIFYIYSTLCMHVSCAIWRDFVIWIKFPIYKAWFTQSYHAKYWVVNLSWLTMGTINMSGWAVERLSGEIHSPLILMFAQCKH